MVQSLLLFPKYGLQDIRRGSGELLFSFNSLMVHRWTRNLHPPNRSVDSSPTHNIRARPLDPPLATKYIKNSLSYDSKEMHQICSAARQSRIAVVLGFS